MSADTHRRPTRPSATLPQDFLAASVEIETSADGLDVFTAFMVNRFWLFSRPDSDALETHPSRFTENPRCCRACERDEAEFWLVYGRPPGGGFTCQSMFDTESAATVFVALLRKFRPWYRDRKLTSRDVWRRDAGCSDSSDRR